MSVESDPRLSILMDCPQYHAKTMNIIGIGIEISVCVLVKPDEGIFVNQEPRFQPHLSAGRGIVRKRCR